MNVLHQTASFPNATLPLNFNQPPPNILAQNMISNYQQQQNRGQGNVSHFEQQQRDLMSVGSNVWDENSTFARNRCALKQPSQHNPESIGRVYDRKKKYKLLKKYFIF